LVVDVHVVEKRLLRLEHILQKLRAASEIPEDVFLGDEVRRDAVERNLQVAIQICIDITSHLAASLGLRSPESYADLFSVLEEEDLLSEDLSQTMKQMVGFRNILVHDYLDIRPDLVYSNLQSLDDFRRFAEEVLAAIEQYAG